MIGASAGFLNVPKLKGTDAAMMSGIIAGEVAFNAMEMADEEAESKGKKPVRGLGLTGRRNEWGRNEAVFLSSMWRKCTTFGITRGSVLLPWNSQKQSHGKHARLSQDLA